MISKRAEGGTRCLEMLVTSIRYNNNTERFLSSILHASKVMIGIYHMADGGGDRPGRERGNE